MGISEVVPNVPMVYSYPMKKETKRQRLSMKMLWKILTACDSKIDARTFLLVVESQFKTITK